MKYLKLYENNIDPFDEEDWDEIDINPLKYTKNEFMIHFINTFNSFLDNYQNHDHLLNIMSYKRKSVNFKINDITVKIIGINYGMTRNKKYYMYDVYIKDKYNNYEYKGLFLFYKFYNDIDNIWNFIRKEGNIKRIKKFKKFIGLKENIDWNNFDWDEDYDNQNKLKNFNNVFINQI